MGLDLQRLKHRLQAYRWYRPLHLAYTGWRARHGGLPRWPDLLRDDWDRWREILAHSAAADARVLVATGAGGHLPSMTMESLLCIGLNLRGARSEMLLCDEALPA